MSDSECGYQSRPAVVEKVQPKKKITKRKASESTRAPSETKSSAKKQRIIDLFGLEDEELLPRVSSGDLGSFLVSRVANGKVRRTADLVGDFYVEVKVYNTDEVASTVKEDRWKKSSVQLKVQLNRNCPQWDALQIFMLRTHELFNTSEPVFYKDST